MASEKQPTDGEINATRVSQDVHITKIDIQDETGEVAAKALAIGAVDPEAARKVRRKIDLHILPFLCVTYAIQFIDKTYLGYSSVYGIIQDNHLQGQDFSWASSIFYFGYLLMEYPGVALLQRFPVAKFLGINIMAWGAILMTTAACSSFGGLATTRFLLGMAEATISPGFVAITGIWWTRQEQAGRSTLWLSFLGVGSFIGVLLAYGIGHVQGSISSWKIIVLVLGGVTVVWGAIFVLVVPDSPTKVKWLSEDEQVIAVQRLIENKTGTKSRRFVKAQIVEAVMDPKVILLGLIVFVNSVASGGLTFGSLIISGFGFDAITTTLLNLPLSAVQIFGQLFIGYLTSVLPKARLHLASVAMITPIIGTCLINNLPQSSSWGRLVGVWLLGTYPAGFMIILGLLATNVAGSTKRSVASGWVFVCYCVGNIVGPQCFKASEAPGYRSGIIAMLCGFILNLVLNQILRLLYVLENRRRDKALENKTPDEIAEMKRESELQGFEDITDAENVMFRYAL